MIIKILQVNMNVLTNKPDMTEKLNWVIGEIKNIEQKLKRLEKKNWATWSIDPRG